MSYNVVTIPPFDRQLKRLAKKFPSLKVEYAELVDSLEENPEQGNAMPSPDHPPPRFAAKS
jgi:mRNA-degrading endonuclease RelE of RelBE toxin-antitoxin system